jgi:hypothetical protein
VPVPGCRARSAPGSVDRRSPNQEAARDHLAADTDISGQQDLRSRDVACCVLAAVEQGRELRALDVAQIDSVSVCSSLVARY